MPRNVYLIARLLLQSDVFPVGQQILTLTLTAESGFDRVFEAFTYMRLKLGESVRFKLLISMLSSQGPSNILFQVGPYLI